MGGAMLGRFLPETCGPRDPRPETEIEIILFPMKTTIKLTWFAVLGIAAGCAIQKVQRVKSDRLVRQAAGEGAYERSHPKSPGQERSALPC